MTKRKLGGQVLGGLARSGLARHTRGSMPAWLLATALWVAPPADDWTPAGAPPPTPWARAGARGWRQCREAERRAIAARTGVGRARGGGPADDARAQLYAQRCPHAVEVLVAAAQAEILEAASRFGEVDVGEDVEANRDNLEALVKSHHEQLEQALRWLDAALAESARRRRRPPYQARYYQAYALTALGRVAEARKAIAMVIATGDVERWRSERMAALVELFDGNIELALRRAHRGVVDSPSDDRVISRYIRALVLDRAGAPAAARAELQSIQREAGANRLRLAMESVLPIHERLFFWALNAQANDLRSPARWLWQAYLQRSEPEAPERVLARRHLEELTPPPTPATGP